MILHFSGTGNSRYAAEFLADRLGDELLDAFAEIRAGRLPAVSSERPYIIVSPTYGWQLPHLLRDWLLAGSFSGSREAYFVLTCGSDIGDAGRGAEEICRQLAFDYRGIQAVIMPENYIAMFSAPLPAEAAEIVRRAEPVLAAAAEKIRAGEAFSPVRTGALDRLKSGFVNRAFYSLFVKADAFTVRESCVSCGVCEKVCPLHNISLREGKPVWGKDCTHCMACICGCPAAAIEYGRKSLGKPRYQCPSYVRNEARGWMPEQKEEV